MSKFSLTGTHWVWEIVNMLINQKATRISSMKESAMLEGSSRNIMQSMSSPRILNTHLLFCDIPRDFVEKKCKIIYILRNPKDVAVSFYNHHVRLLDYEYSGTWRSYLTRFLSGRGEWPGSGAHTWLWSQVVVDRLLPYITGNLFCFCNTRSNSDMWSVHIARKIEKISSSQHIINLG